MKSIKLSQNDQNQMNILKQSIEQSRSRLAQQDENEKSSKAADVVSMINYYTKLTQAIEERRNKIHNFTVQLLAICVAALTLIVPNMNKIPNIILYPAIGVLIVLLLSCIVSIFIFSRQSGFNYPFLQLQEYGNKWKWFYYGNQEINKIDTDPVFVSKSYKNTLEPFLKGMKIFFNNYVDEDIDKKLIDDMQQLYLLQVHNYYKNKFFLQLTNIRKWAVGFSIAALILGLAAWFFTDVLNMIGFPQTGVSGEHIALISGVEGIEQQFVRQIKKQLGDNAVSKFHIVSINAKSQDATIEIDFQAEWAGTKTISKGTVSLVRIIDRYFIGTFSNPKKENVKLILLLR